MRHSANVAYNRSIAMDNDLANRIAAAKELLRTTRYVAVATVNADGSPHNSPLFFIPDPKLEHFYWGSHPDSLHSQNVVRTGKIFVVLFNDIGGLYIAAENGHALEGDELAVALDIHNTVRARYGKNALPLEYYNGGSPQRMWVAKITEFSVNTVERGVDGHVARDGREKVRREDLLG